jgi:hypothetical protein
MNGTRAVVLGLCGALTACDFELVDPPAPPHPQFNVFVHVSDADSTDILFQADLQLGVDSTGRQFQLADSSLSVNGVQLRPAFAKPRSNSVLYAWTGRLSAPPAALDVALPSFVAIPSHHVVVPVANRLDPYVIHLNAGEDLLLHVTSVGDSAHLTDAPFWQLTLRQSCTQSSGPNLAIVGSGPYPSELRVPRALIADLATQPFEACFLLQSRYSMPGALPISAFVLSDVRWRIGS